MRRIFLLIVYTFVCQSLILSQNYNDTSWQYLGQDQPGLKPEVFAPGIISGKGRLHCFPSFSSDGKEIIWMTLPPKILHTKFIKQWSEPNEISLSKQYICLFPLISPDDKRLYFASGNIPNGNGGVDLWYVEKSDSLYSEPINIGSPINTNRIETQPSITKLGTIYYTSYVVGKRWNRGISRSIYENGKYLTPEILGQSINIVDSNAIDYTPFIASDESFLLFCSNRENLTKEECRIYVSFRDSTDSWSEPINVNEIMGFDFDSRNPYVSPDAKFIFFCSGENIYWVSSRIIDEIKGVNKTAANSLT